MNKIAKIVGAMVISQGLCGVADAVKPGAYIEGGVGYGSYSTISGGVAGKVAAGYNFNRYLGLEVGYNMYSKYSQNFFIDDEKIGLDLNLNAITFLGKGYIPLKDSPWDVYGLLGMAYMRENVKANYHNFDILSYSQNDPVLAVGGGLSRQLGQHFRSGIEYMYTDEKHGDDEHVGIPQTNLVTFNLAYTFD